MSITRPLDEITPSNHRITYQWSFNENMLHISVYGKQWGGRETIILTPEQARELVDGIDKMLKGHEQC